MMMIVLKMFLLMTLKINQKMIYAKDGNIIEDEKKSIQTL